MKLKDVAPKFEDYMRANSKEPYEDTGANAPKGVQVEIEKWKRLPDEEKAAKPLLYHLLGSGTPPYKMDPAEADYKEKSEVKGEACGNCEFTYLKISNKKFICSQISGHITPAAWCRLWKPQK